MLALLQLLLSKAVSNCADFQKGNTPNGVLCSTAPYNVGQLDHCVCLAGRNIQSWQ